MNFPSDLSRLSYLYSDLRKLEALVLTVEMMVPAATYSHTRGPVVVITHLRGITGGLCVSTMVMGLLKPCQGKRCQLLMQLLEESCGTKVT